MSLYSIEKLENEIKQIEFSLVNHSIASWDEFLKLRWKLEGLRSAVELVKEAEITEQSFEEFIEEEGA